MRVVESVESGHTAHDVSAVVAKAAGVVAPSLRMDSQAKYGAVGRGDAQLYLRLPRPGKKKHDEKIWDHAGGMIIVEEAGGKVTDIYGKPLDFSKGITLVDNTGIVASNGDVHDAAIAELAKQFPVQ
eukprot:TRINITY_DN11359_c0_g3_i3.p2 TRINITY_DN11359_c0_g3~~TRINITY_DN11359_c0_g3_i3.p2  ORF type:complete len:127 (+),score=29.81 TRINITY_DN11359_c0_g3_i3:746-1126(+)